MLTLEEVRDRLRTGTHPESDPELNQTIAKARARLPETQKENALMLTLEEVREHLRLDEYPYEDQDLLRLIDVAIEQVQFGINQPIQDPAPASLKQAALLIIGHLYENRESTTTEALKMIPMGVRYLMHPYRKEVLNSYHKCITSVVN